MVARSYDNINICKSTAVLRQYQHLHPSAPPCDTAEWVVMVGLPYLVVTITELSYGYVTWHSLVNYHDKHYVTVYKT